VPSRAKIVVKGYAFVGTSVICKGFLTVNETVYVGRMDPSGGAGKAI
jgi:hypothetical protein